MRFLTILLLTCFSFSVYAQQPILQGEEAPEDGVFLTNQEAARILSSKEALEKRCQADMAHEKKKTETLCEFEKKNLNSNINFLKEKNKELMDLKNKEIIRLQDLLKEETFGDDTLWFVGGLSLGFVVATISSVAIFFAATQIDKAPYIPGE